MSATGTVGRYQILGELGRGATGVVYRAQDPAIGRMVAIKTIPLTATSPVDREEHLERLRREAQLSGRLSHPGVVTVYDFIENTESAYVCMELVEGESLAGALERRRRFSQQEVLQILRESAEALDYAHQQGVIHRDIKPGNILIREDGEAKITDFGVARAIADDATVTGTMHGTPAYMSPEQVHSRPAGGRSDQFSLGAVAYELLTGERPFPGDSMASIAYKVSSEPAVPPSILNTTLSPAVDGVFARVLAKDPTMRFASARDFVTDLGRSLAVTPGWEAKVRGECAANATTVSTPRLLRRRRNRSALYGTLAAVAIAGAILAIFWTASATRRPIAPDLAGIAKAPPPAPAEQKQPAALPPVPIIEPPPPSEIPIPAPAPLGRPSAEALQGMRYVYNVAIESVPGGATVHLDNLPLPVCVTPCRVALTPGMHSLKFERAGYRPRISELEVPGLSSVLVELEQREGTLLVKSKPPGASIFVDGRKWDQPTPTTLTLPVGLRQIVVRYEGFPTESRQVEIRDGALSTLEIDWR
jgi:hypothetical protein